ncbi:uncharacterized protein LOC134761166 [Pongo abelii]|uniref:uncharacterized protein LOC134761166 n=1 Tax=Pongo abelii TaxID=9601 RepID=UPI003004E51B
MRGGYGTQRDLGPVTGLLWFSLSWSAKRGSWLRSSRQQFPVPGCSGSLTAGRAGKGLLLLHQMGCLNSSALPFIVPSQCLAQNPFPRRFAQCENGPYRGTREQKVI